MHNAAFEKLKLDAEYRIFDVDPKKIDEFLNCLLRSDISGLNVTVPYKIKAFEFVKKYGSVDKEAAMLGAINTIVIDNKTLSGHNTDVYGFMKSVETDLGFNPRMKNIFVIGAGGAGSAIAVKIARAAEKIFIYDTDQDKMKTFSANFLRHYGKDKLVQVSANDLKSAVGACHLLINATPYGRHEGEMVIDPSFLHKNLSVYDLIYNPEKTPLIKEAEKLGLPAANGLGMLLYQGAKSFELWTKKKAPIAVMKESLVKALKNP